MTSNFKHIKSLLVCVFMVFVTAALTAQRDTNKWKAQLALGFNNPSQSGFVADFESKPINFPTVNLGIQHMFKSQLGAKVDFGFNRFSSEDSSPEFKTNYTRLNLQVVYDPTETLTFLPERMGLVAHAGPGYSFVKPLGNYSGNDVSFLNAMAGLEVHYAFNRRMSFYTDVSYILGFGKDFDPITEGYGAFNGNLLTVTFGITFSLSGCQYC